MARSTLTADGTLMFFCPGCQEHHGVAVKANEHVPKRSLWQWDGEVDKPTLKPSILVRGVKAITDEQADRIMAGEKVEPVPYQCHSFVEGGRIQFLNDCSHSLAGQTVDLPDEF